MFVLKSTYLQSLHENQQLQEEIARLENQNNQLQQNNTSLLDQVEQALSPTDIHYKEMLLQCAIECISQVEGVRETVLNSYQAIDSESRSSDLINSLLDVSSESLQHIVNDMR